MRFTLCPKTCTGTPGTGEARGIWTTEVQTDVNGTQANPATRPPVAVGSPLMRFDTVAVDAKSKNEILDLSNSLFVSICHKTLYRSPWFVQVLFQVPCQCRGERYPLPSVLLQPLRCEERRWPMQKNPPQRGSGCHQRTAEPPAGTDFEEWTIFFVNYRFSLSWILTTIAFVHVDSHDILLASG